jgi:hypothetical protein
VRRSHPGGNLGLLPDGSVSLCDRGGCVFGRHRLADTVGRRFAIDFDPEFVALMETRLEQGLDDALDNAFRRNVILDLVLRPDESRTLVKIDRDGKRGVLKAKWVFDAYIENAPGPYRHLRFAWVWKLQRAEVVRP